MFVSIEWLNQHDMVFTRTVELRSSTHAGAQTGIQPKTVQNGSFQSSGSECKRTSFQTLNVEA